MPRMTKAQAKKRLNEARKKIQAVYIAGTGGYQTSLQFFAIVSTQDMAAIEKILDKCLKRLN